MGAIMNVTRKVQELKLHPNCIGTRLVEVQANNHLWREILRGNVEEFQKLNKRLERNMVYNIVVSVLIIHYFIMCNFVFYWGSIEKMLAIVRETCRVSWQQEAWWAN